MTKKELAMELAQLEGVEQMFDLIVKDSIEASRANSMKRMLRAPGMAPSAAVKQAQTLENALEKFDHNLRIQYEAFLDSYVSTREALFTDDQIERFIATLRDPHVQNYLTEMRNFRKELNRSITEVINRMCERATKGTGAASTIGVHPH
jgi:hypothetical protein